VNVTSFMIAPGERRDVLVDITGAPVGTKVRLLNDANGPFPDGSPVTNNNNQIIQFTVTGAPGSGFRPHTLPSILNPTLTGAFPTLTSPSVARNLTLKEWEGPNGPLMVTIDGQQYSSPISETPYVGATEIWRIIDDTPDGHPIHLHMVNFQILSRQAFNQTAYDAAWMALNGGQLPFPSATQNVDLTQFLIGNATGALPIEMTWKDTVQIMPGEVLTIIVKFAPADPSTPTFPFDPTEGPDLVWHCHIVDHEDQDMIRPYHVLPLPV
jgi:spore coat protein A